MEISFRLHARSLGSPSSNSFFGQFLLNKLFFSLIVRFKNISKRLCVLTNLYNEVLQGACFKAHNAFWEKLLLNGDREYFLRLSFGWLSGGQFPGVFSITCSDNSFLWLFSLHPLVKFPIKTKSYTTARCICWKASLGLSVVTLRAPSSLCCGTDSATTYTSGNHNICCNTGKIKPLEPINVSSHLLVVGSAFSEIATLFTIFWHPMSSVCYFNRDYKYIY